MYIPAAFAESDETKLFEFIAAHSFGLLVSQLHGELFATHLPLLARGEGCSRQLWGHVARANPQWQELSGQNVLAIFSGPHAYISPTWYESENVVPTWNYVAVHVYGKCDLLEPGPATAEVLQEMVTTYEHSLPQPWTMDAEGPFFRKLAQAIVALRIDVSRVEGKWKLGQNHPVERREKVARQLTTSSDPQAVRIAQLMAETLK